MSRRTPDETIATIRRLRRKGHSISEIVAQVNLARSVVHRHCEDIALPFGPLKRGPKSKVSRLTVLKLREQGMSYRKIGQVLQLAHSAVHRAIKQGRAA